MNDVRRQFELVRPTIGPGVPLAVAEILISTGIPRRIIEHEYWILDAAAPLPGGDSGDALVAFAGSRRVGRICVDPTSLAVVFAPFAESPIRCPVNASLSQFNASVRAVIDRYPFYDEDFDESATDGIADELETVLSGIDQTSLSYPGFWYEFISDVRFGDYPAGDHIEEAMN